MKMGTPNDEFDECRWDPFNRRWVIISHKRAFRPHSTGSIPPREIAANPCPFCPGHEAQTPPPRYVDRDPAQEQFPWRVRVVDNLYGALNRNQAGPSGEEKILPPGSRRLPASGLHEIIIETPVHDKHAADYTDEEMAAVLRAYRNRLQAAWSEPGIAYAVVFKNHGPEAGASLEHGHSQLIALPFIPPATLRPGDDCLLCAVIRFEQGGPRAIARPDSLLVWSPYPGAFPYEAWIAPTSHSSDFLTLDDDAIYLIAVVLRDLLRGLVKTLGNVPYNLLLQTAPPHGEALNHPWHFELIPRTTQLAGFELGTGTVINPTAPEHSARELRLQMEAMGHVLP